MIEVENAPCVRCEKPVHLLHDAPQPCGDVICPDCPTCECIECQAIRSEVCS